MFPWCFLVSTSGSLSPTSRVTPFFKGLEWSPGHGKQQNPGTFAGFPWEFPLFCNRCRWNWFDLQLWCVESMFKRSKLRLRLILVNLRCLHGEYVGSQTMLVVQNARLTGLPPLKSVRWIWSHGRVEKYLQVWGIPSLQSIIQTTGAFNDSQWKTWPLTKRAGVKNSEKPIGFQKAVNHWDEHPNAI